MEKRLTVAIEVFDVDENFAPLRRWLVRLREVRDGRHMLTLIVIKMLMSTKKRKDVDDDDEDDDEDQVDDKTHRSRTVLNLPM